MVYITTFRAPCRLRLAVKICVSESVTVIEFSITDLEKTITLTVLPVTDIENGPMQCFFTALGLNYYFLTGILSRNQYRSDNSRISDSFISFRSKSKQNCPNDQRFWARCVHADIKNLVTLFVEGIMLVIHPKNRTASMLHGS